MGQTTFAALGVAPTLLSVLDKLGYVEPTPIQAKAIPTAVEGKDVVGIAQTGTGKTLAFGIPMIQRLGFIRGQGLVLLPTRELALQVEEALTQIGRSFGLRVAVLIGGAGMGPQISALRAKPHVIVATPGRLLDHLEQSRRFGRDPDPQASGRFNLSQVKILVLDEADRMLDMGFAPQIRKILAVLPGVAERQTMLFSATMPHEIMRMATHHMRLPIRIEVAPQGTTADKVTQEIFIVDKPTKNRLLEKILVERPVSTLIFTRTKHGATRLMRVIRAMGHSAAEIHGNRSLGQRKEALEGFRKGRYRILVATDIASRGIDVTGIGLVLNYDLPTDSEDYVHRIGRTARAGSEGHAISFAEPTQRHDLRDIERLIRKTLPISQLPQDLPPVRAVAETPRPFRPHSRPFTKPFHPRQSNNRRRYH